MTEIIVETTSGKLRGMERRGVVQFRGVAYAAPPVGERRFRPPEPSAPWAGVRDADAYGPMAPQNPSPLGQVLGQGDTDQSEDCLTLNVFTPAPDGARRPVMVWIHGGAFLIGANSVPWWDGANLAQRDVVVVTINYRLGALGFSHLADLAPGEDFEGSGNAGILDQAAALRWVAENIGAFGGDPGNVTIFGESAGGMSVGTLLGLPAAAGLFHRAVAQSGAQAHIHSRERADGVARDLLDELGLDPARARELQPVPVQRLLEAQAQVTARHWAGGAAQTQGIAIPFQPVLDGTTLPEHPATMVERGAAAIPLVVGTTAEELKLFTTFDPSLGELTDEGLVARADQVLSGEGHDPAAFVAAYRQRLGQDEGPVDVWSAVLTDRVFRIPAIRLAERQAAHQPATFMYLFSWRSSAFDGRLGSCHALDIPFTFDNLDAPGASLLAGDPTPVARELARRVADAWAAFARDGKPSADGLPHWPAYEPERRATMVLDEECSVVDDPSGDERRLWDGVA